MKTCRNIFLFSGGGDDFSVTIIPIKVSFIRLCLKERNCSIVLTEPSKDFVAKICQLPSEQCVVSNIRLLPEYSQISIFGESVMCSVNTQCVSDEWFLPSRSL